MVNKTLKNDWKLSYPAYLEAVWKSLELEKLIEFHDSFSSKKNYDICEFQGSYYQVFLDKEKKEILIGSAFFRDELFLQKEEYLKASQESVSYLSDYEIGTKEYELEDLVKGSLYAPEKESLKKIRESLLKEIGNYRTSLFEKASDLALFWTAKYEVLRLYLLKFLAILPCLDHDKSGEEVKRIFLETLRRLRLANEKMGESQKLPFYLSATFWGMEKISSFIPASLLAKMVRSGVEILAKRFIAGVNIEKAEKSLLSLKTTGREATLDQLGELVISDEEADIYQKKVMDIISGLKKYYEKGERNKAGILKAHVSIKVSALCAQFIPQDFDYTYKQIAPRLEAILKLASQEKVFINVDAEHYHYREVIFRVYEKCLKKVLKTDPDCETGIVVQAYLKDGAKHLQDILEMAKSISKPITLRLVKGAYWDAETLEAQAGDYPPPQFLNKEETDLNFRQLALEILKNHDFLKLTLASHNILDHAWIRGVWEKSFSHLPPIEHQCLHMTYEALSTALAKKGWPVRNYIPVGNLLVGMAYLVRRIMENSSQVGVLQIMRSHQDAHLLKEPEEIFQGKKERTSLQDYFPFKKDFVNTSPARAYLPQTLKELKKAYQGMDSLEEFSLQTPSNEIEEKIEKMKGLTGEWFLSSQKRREACTHLAHLLLKERFELSHLISLEAGKSLLEALADVDEAVDFLRFYAREEEKVETLPALGLIAVIAPWNFPLAIPVGMSIAALMAGNAVLLKPAEQTPRIIKTFLELAREAGIPSEAFDIVWGDGEQGKLLSESDDIDAIVFTGSKQVGELLYRKGVFEKKNRHGDERVVIAEMGGKNPIIVTNNCELDETIDGCLYACFAHAGQKCSAASRILVHNEVKENFLKRFIPAVQNLKVASGLDFSSYINPVIGKEEQSQTFERVKKLEESLENSEGRVLLNLAEKYKDEKGFLVGPVLVEISKEMALKKEAFFDTEFFAPIVHIVGYDSHEEALKMVGESEYALTAGVFAQSEDDLDFFIQGIEGGNIYTNRPNTGARVGIEPFGGYKMSGTGPKAGSTSYLKSFKRGVYSFSELSISLEDFKKYREEKIPNTFVPNQLSYTEHHKAVESIDYIIGEDLPSAEWKSLLELGEWAKSKTRFYINKEAQKEWLAFFPNLKIEKENFPQDFSELVFISQNKKLPQREKPFTGYLPKFYRVGLYKFKTKEASEVYDFFLRQRSLAVNIMRHGAPLNLF